MGHVAPRLAGGRQITDTWPEPCVSKTAPRSLLGSAASQRFWSRNFDAAEVRAIDAWSYYMIYSTVTHSQMTVVPSRNLTTSIGFGPDAVHSKDIEVRPHGDAGADVPTGSPQA